MAMVDLSREERLRLIRLVVGLAWVDGRMQDSERDFIRRLAVRIELHEEDALVVSGWLIAAPRTPEPDLGGIAPNHKKFFLQTAREMVLADGMILPQEATKLAALEKALR